MALRHHFENPESFAIRFIRHMATQLIRHSGFRDSEFPDIEMELVLEIVRKWPCYDPARASESTFIARIVRSKATTLMRARLAEKRDYRRDGGSLNETVRDESGNAIERSQTIDASLTGHHTGQARRSDEEQASLRMDVHEQLEQLPEDDRLLAELLMELTEYAATRLLGQSRRQTAKAVRRLRERFEDAGLRDYL